MNVTTLTYAGITHQRQLGCWSDEDGKGWWSVMLCLNMYIGCVETHHSHSHIDTLTGTQERLTISTQDHNFKLMGRHSSICFVISLSYPILSLFIISILVQPVCIDHQSLPFSLPLPFASHYTSHSLSINYRQSLFHMNPLRTMATKQMCVSNPDGVISMLGTDRGEGDKIKGGGLRSGSQWKPKGCVTVQDKCASICLNKDLSSLLNRKI